MHEEVSAREVPALVNVLQTRPLQFSTSDTNVVPATPVKRRGKCMSRRTGQDGHIEASGKWWVVRWWMDVAGQEARRHMRAKVCPISGPGHLSKSERERRAREIVAESGADTLEHFDKVVKQTRVSHSANKQNGGSTISNVVSANQSHLQHWNYGKAASKNGSTQTSEIYRCPK